MPDNYFNISQHNTMANMYVNIDLRGGKQTVNKVKKTMDQIKKVRNKFRNDMRIGPGGEIDESGSLIPGLSGLTSIGSGIFSGLLSAVKKMFGIIGRTFSNTVSGMTRAVGSFVGSSLTLAGAKIQSEMKLRTLLGDKRFNAFQPKLQEFALNQNPRFKTTQDISDIRSFAGTLIASGMNENATIPFISRLNDLLGNDRSMMQREIVNLSQILAGDRAYTLDVRQMTSKGVPIFEGIREALSVSMGRKVAMDEVRDLIKTGNVTAETWLKALEVLTDPNGRFYNLVRRQMDTTPGQQSIFRSLIKNLKELFGEPLLTAMLPVFKMLNGILIGISPDVKKLGSSLGQMVIDFAAFYKTSGLKDTAKTFIDGIADSIPGVSNFARILAMKLFGIPEDQKAMGWTEEMVENNITIYQKQISRMFLDVFKFAWDKFKEYMWPTVKEATDYIKGQAKELGTIVGGAIIDEIKKGLELNWTRKRPRTQAEIEEMFKPKSLEQMFPNKYKDKDQLRDEAEKRMMQPGEYYEWKSKQIQKKLDHDLKYSPLPAGSGAGIIFNNEIYADDVSSVLQDQLMAAKYQFELTEALI